MMLAASIWARSHTTRASTWVRRSGSPVYAPQDGVITSAGWNGSYGLMCRCATCSAGAPSMHTSPAPP